VVAGLLAGDALLLVEHLAMLALMLLVLRRRAEYGGSSHG
jgi:hypothetical protein